VIIYILLFGILFGLERFVCEFLIEELIYFSCF